jgi:hypothetical protein
MIEMYQITGFSLDHIEAGGSWYDIGLTEGREERAAVKYTLYRYAKYHSGDEGIVHLGETVDLVEGFLAHNFPQELDELRGIADGAGVDRALLLAANFPGAWTAVSRDSDVSQVGGREHCSNIMFPTSEWGPLLGGTLDDDPLRFILTCKPDDGIDFCCIMWPGWVACTWGGMNAEGLAICGASAGALTEKNEATQNERIPGLEGLFCQRVILRSCANISEALELLSRPEIILPGNLSLMERSGRGVQVQGYEPGGRKPRVFDMQGDRGLYCGNFYPWEIGPEEFDRYPDHRDAFGRYLALMRGEEEYRDRYSVEGMKTILTRHEENLAGGVCNNGTIIAMIAAPQRNKLLLASRPPCVQGFEDYSLG